MSGFSDYKVDESEYAGRDIQSIEETVITGKADWLKARFDALSKDVIVAKYNDMLDYLEGAEAAGSIGSSGGTVQEELDGYISKYAIGWNLSRISRTARAIMQLAMYECLYVHDVPVSAAINEAVELTRKYENEDVVSFVNGILGGFAREVQQSC